MTFTAYSATLLVVTGTTAQPPATEWELNPDTIMVPAGGSVTLRPHTIPLGFSGTVTLGSPSSDAGITVTVTGATLRNAQFGSVLVTAGNTPGFYHFTIPATDSTGASTTQSGWTVVGKPAAGLSKTGNNQTGAVGTTLNLSVTLVRNGNWRKHLFYCECRYIVEWFGDWIARDYYHQQFRRCQRDSNSTVNRGTSERRGGRAIWIGTSSCKFYRDRSVNRWAVWSQTSLRICALELIGR